MAKDFLVDTGNPVAVDLTLNQIGAVLVGAPDYVKRDGYYVMRVLRDEAVGFVKFACEHQGYCKIIKELTELV